MYLTPRFKLVLKVIVALAVLFLYLPLLLVVVNSVNPSRTFAFPPTGVTLRWWSAAWNSDGLLAAFWTSVKAGLGATAIALLLGSATAFAVQRHKFFGRDAVSFLVVLPIALPGIVTGIALNAAFRNVLGPLGIGLGLTTVIIGHSTFCVVVVFNNVQARLRRMNSSLTEASGDLGGTGWQTFRLVTFPGVRSALLAGSLLAFGLSFDEIVVTTFTSSPSVQTLPLWIFANLFRPNQAPVIDVVAVVLIVLAVLPVWLSQKVGDGAAAGRF